MSKTQQFYTLILLVFLSHSLEAKTERLLWKNYLKGVQINDLTSFPIFYVPIEIKSHLNALQKGLYPIDKLFPVKKKEQTDLGHFLTNIPYKEGEKYFFEILKILENPNKTLTLIKKMFTLQTVNQQTVAKNIKSKTVSSDDLDLYFETSLIERKITLFESNLGFKLVFPVGVGGFDQAVNSPHTKIVTPAMEGIVSKHFSIEKRTFPPNFAGAPFIRIIISNGYETTKTEYGIHIQQNTGLIRGFYSHGCIRARPNDLDLLFKFVSYSHGPQIPIKIILQSRDQSDHPYPKENYSYKTVINYGTEQNPFSKKTSATINGVKYPPLTAMKIIFRPPPIDLIPLIPSF